MKTFEHLLVPTDFGEPAARALDLAIALASTLGSKLTILHAVWLAPSTLGSPEGPYWPVDSLLKDDEADFDATLASAKARYPATTGMLVTGDPLLVIPSTAKRLGCDLVVMGTHGRRGLSRLVLGSVAEKIVRTSPVAVLTVGATGPRAVDVVHESNVPQNPPTTRKP